MSAPQDTPRTPPGDPAEAPGGDPRRWYEAGLAFRCTACGNCCRDHGEYAYVYVSDKDLQGLARHHDLSEEAFLASYCDEDEGWTILKRRGDACVLLGDDGLCTAYEARPKQCATWPFWVDTLRSERAWREEAKACCPGIDQGEVTPADTCERIALETEAWYEDE